MRITATLVNLYNVCKREMWLHANGIRFEHTSDLVFEGKLIHEDSYPQRSGKYEEIELDGIKVDFYDPKRKLIHEIKKSNKVEAAHEWQLKYYIYVFERKFLANNKTGILWDGKIGISKMMDTGILDIDSEEDFRLMEVIAHHLYENYPDFAAVRNAIRA